MKLFRFSVETRDIHLLHVIAGLAFEDPDITMGACKATDMESEIPEEDFGGLENATPDVFVSVRDANEVKEKTLGDDRGANLIPPSSSFYVRPKCPSSDHPLAISAGLENTTPDVFVSVRDANNAESSMMLFFLMLMVRTLITVSRISAVNILMVFLGIGTGMFLP
uniref:Uncharacterized protein n=1 Tax=Lotus japonicus TaxID=34305 RepID=I3SL21_LOTJA|nr:unknown [Lotus japonicus]